MVMTPQFKISWPWIKGFAGGGVIAGDYSKTESRILRYAQGSSYKEIMTTTPRGWGYGDHNWDTSRYTKEDHPMSKNKDRVKFYLPARYYQRYNHCNNMDRVRCFDILKKAFGIDRCESETLMTDHPQGFTILCRPSQFGRFIVYRNTYGDCVNGIKDLRPDVVRERDRFGEVAERVGIDRDDVRQVACALGLNNQKLGWPDVDVDVSGRHNSPHFTETKHSYYER